MTNLKNYLPIFPKFKPLELEDRVPIEKFTSKFSPYSDYNFISLWSWNVEDRVLISTFKDCLILKFDDYVSREPFYSFLGTTKIVETAQILVEHAKQTGLKPHLKLIPEIIVTSKPEIRNIFRVEEDRDNFDYIYLINQLISLDGNKLRSKRNFVNRFKKHYHFTSKLLNFKSEIHQQEMLQLFEIWRKARLIDPMEVKNELMAIKRFFQLKEFSNLLIVGVYINGRLISFSINEILNHGYAINLFEKGDIEFEGIFSYLKHLTALYLSRKGCQFLNHEQDLGIPGLRQSKMSYAPKFFLKKYIIFEKDAV